MLERLFEDSTGAKRCGRVKETQKGGQCLTKQLQYALSLDKGRSLLKRLLTTMFLMFALTVTTVLPIVSPPTPATAASTHHAHRIHWYAPLLSLSPQSTVACILHAESRSTYAHPNLKDTNFYQFGPFQFTPILWDRWAWEAGVGAKTRSWYLGTTALDSVTIPAYRATLYEQAEVFAYVARHDGMWPWQNSDGC